MKKKRVVVEGFSTSPGRMIIIRRIARKEGRFVSAIICEAIDDWIAKRESEKATAEGL